MCWSSLRFQSPSFMAYCGCWLEILTTDLISDQILLVKSFDFPHVFHYRNYDYWMQTFSNSYTTAGRKKTGQKCESMFASFLVQFGWAKLRKIFASFESTANKFRTCSLQTCISYTVLYWKMLSFSFVLSSELEIVSKTFRSARAFSEFNLRLWKLYVLHNSRRNRNSVEKTVFLRS